MDDEDKLELQQTLSYGYSNEARPDQLTSFNGEAITYNTDGTPAIYRGLNCTFTRGKLTAIGDNTFVYDASGLRVKKNDTTYTYLEGKLLREQGPDGTLDFLYGAEGIMGFVYNGETYFYRKNLFGDVTHIYDADGLLVASYVYDAWGNHTIKNEDDFDEIGNVNPIRYRGYYYDDELGLYYLRARYYDPDTGRFISQDSIDYVDPEHLMGLNLYAYCGNDPVTNTDPGGNFFLTALIVGAFVGAAVGFGTTVYEDYKDDGEVFNGSISPSSYVKEIVEGTAVGALAGAMVGMGNPEMIVEGALAVGEELVADTVSSAMSGSNNFGDWKEYAMAFSMGGFISDDWGKSKRITVAVNSTLILAQPTLNYLMDDNYSGSMFFYDTFAQGVTNKPFWKWLREGDPASRLGMAILQGMLQGWRNTKAFK